MDIIQGIGPADLIDIAVVAVLIATAMGWLRRSRARLALTGLAFLVAVYLAARAFGLSLTAWILQGFFAVLVLVLVVVFQEDLRRIFEQIAVWGLRRREPELPTGREDVIVSAVERLARNRTGALLVFPGRDPLDRHIEGGEPLDGRLGEALLLSLFDTSSPGHDGAVVVRGGRVGRFGARLPLSSDSSRLEGRGTRHAAGLGLAERTDALVVVVSEERGEVSIARRGELRILRHPSELKGELAGFLAAPEEIPDAPGKSRRAGRWGERALALLLAAILWVVFVLGSSVVEVRRSLPVTAENVPAGFAIVETAPPEIEVTFAGRRRDLIFGRAVDSRIRVDAFLLRFGQRDFPVTPEQVAAPRGAQVLGIRPDHVRFEVIAPDGHTSAEGIDR